MWTEPERFLHRDDVAATYDRETGSMLIVKDRVRPVSPMLIDISVTLRCSAGCPFCYQDATPEGKEADPDIILNGLKNLPFKPFQIALGGGEPVNWPKLLDFCRDLEDLDIDATMTVGPGISDDGLFQLSFTPRTLKAIGVSFVEGGDDDLFCDVIEERRTKAVAHIVLHRENLEALAKRFHDRWWPDGLSGVVLLLPKPVGRGVRLTPPTKAEILSFINEAVMPWYNWYGGTRTVAADPCLGITIPGLPTFLLSGCDEEGFSSERLGHIRRFPAPGLVNIQPHYG